MAIADDFELTFNGGMVLEKDGTITEVDKEGRL
jgi:hypothetical protein